MKIKVKLAAIAKDEGAYLPEWIHHHLYFGFDDIEIYINNSTDNSHTIVDNVKKYYPVNNVDADNLIKKYKINFQVKTYQEIVKKAKKDGFTHLMFLDIDEFWTPKDFNTNIHSAINALPKADVHLFHWFIHTDEGDFTPCFKGSVKGRFDRTLKYLVNLNAKFKPEIHNAIGKLTYCKASGESIKFDVKDKVRASINHPKGEVDDFFIVHRLFRGQKEYISLLYRGRPKGDKIKNNRAGYYKKNNKFGSVTFNQSLLTKYFISYNEFLEKCSLIGELNIARQFVEDRFLELINFAKTNDDAKIKGILRTAFQNVSLPEIEKLKDHLTSNERKIFQIGFNKSGTGSIYQFMKNNGFSSVHWDGGHLSKKLQENYNLGKPLLYGYEQYQVFTDMEHRERNQLPYYSYQLYFKELDKQYPNSVFILNIRDIRKWIQSRVKHPGYLERSMKAMGLQREEVIEKWEKHYHQHINDVTLYFKGRDNLIVIDLDYDAKEKLYNELTQRGFHLSKKALPHTHKTPKTADEVQDEHINNIRNAAIYYEKNDLDAALCLMKVAQKLRPKGKFINNKIQQYEKKLNLHN